MDNDELHRITEWPTERITSPDGAALAHQSDLTSEQIRESLRGDSPTVGIVNVGHPIRWVSGNAVFEVWKSKVRSRLNEPDDHPGNDGETRFWASLWSSVDGCSEVIVFFAHH